MKDVTVEGSGTAFVNCSAAGSTDPNNSKSGGGAIYQADGATMTLTNVTFGADGDKTKGCTATGEYGFGGAIYTVAENATLTDCSFYYCHTTGDHSSGGALLYNNKNGNLSLYGCVFVDCTVNNTVSSSTSSLTKPATSGLSAQTEKMLLAVTTPSLKRSMSRRQSTKR